MTTDQLAQELEDLLSQLASADLLMANLPLTTEQEHLWHEITLLDASIRKYLNFDH